MALNIRNSVAEALAAEVAALTVLDTSAVLAILLVARADVTLVPVDVDQAYVARQPFRTYGKGRHAANLNFGDCFAYALSRTSAEPLLSKGSDFARTDVATVRPAT